MKQNYPIPVGMRIKQLKTKQIHCEGLSWWYARFIELWRRCANFLLICVFKHGANF